MSSEPDYGTLGALAGHEQRTHCQGMPLRKMHLGECDGSDPDCSCQWSGGAHFFSSKLRFLLCHVSFSDHQANPHVCPKFGQDRPVEQDEVDMGLPRGERIRQRRIELGMTLREIGALCSCDFQQVRYIEQTGKVPIHLRAALARALQVSQFWLRS